MTVHIVHRSKDNLNRICKESIKGLGANKTERAVNRVGKALGTIVPVLTRFDVENGVSYVSGAHKRTSTDKDVDIVLTELQRCFSRCPARSHPTFPNPADPLHVKTHTELLSWIEDHINVYC